MEASPVRDPQLCSGSRLWRLVSNVVNELHRLNNFIDFILLSQEKISAVRQRYIFLFLLRQLKEFFGNFAGGNSQSKRGGLFTNLQIADSPHMHADNFAILI